MKFSTSAVLALAPLAMGRRVARDGHKAMEPVVEEHPAPVAPPMMEHPAQPPVMEHPAPPAMEHPAAPAPPAEHIPPPKVEMPAEHKPVEMPPHMIWAHPGGKEAETTTIHEKVTVTQTIIAGDHPTEVPMHDGMTTTIKEHETATVPGAGASHTVTVGGPGGLIFQPDQLHDVPVGDTIIFEFLSQNHTVTQSPFDTPCEALPDGMDSGFMANPDNSVVPPPQVAMQVMGDAPLCKSPCQLLNHPHSILTTSSSGFYCAQGNHCGSGMVFSVNPTAEKTHAMFQAMAIEQNGDGAASPITGGEGAPPPPESAPAPPAGTPAAGGGVGNVPGQGQVVEGSCVCMVSCSAEGFPAPEQGLNARGGIAGTLPSCPLPQLYSRLTSYLPGSLPMMGSMS